MSFREWLKKLLTFKTNGDNIITMTIQDRLKDLVEKKGLRRVAQELGIDHGQLYRSIHSDLRLSTLQSILNYFGYDLKIVKRKEAKEEDHPGQDGETIL